MKINVALTEDNSFLAKSIIEKLGLFSDQVLFHFWAKNGQDLLSQLKDNHALDIVLMDIEMPLLNGIETTEKVTQQYPHIKVIMLTVIDDEQRIFDAIQAGASGYLLKDERPKKLLEALKMVMAGGAPMSPSIAAKTLKMLRNPQRITTSITKEDFNLSKRETQVLEQLATGLDYTKIADNLFISPATVRKHIENIYRKLQVNNKMMAVQKAQKHGLVG